MDITLAGSAVAYTPNDSQLTGATIELAAFDGEIGTGRIPVDDPTDALSVYDGRAALVKEIATTLLDGFIIDQDRARGDTPAGPAVVQTYSVMDPNALLGGFRVERSRVVETDVARVLAFAALDLPTFDTTWVLNASTVSMPARVYHGDGGWTSELIPDLVEQTGKTLFVHDKASGGRCLHYHVLTSGHTCGLSISDVAGAPNDTTVWYPSQPSRVRTSVDLHNDIKGVDQANRISTATDATSIARHDADGLKHQTLITFDASSQADLAIKTAAYLATTKDERDTWMVGIGPLDATALALIRVGDLITVTSTILALTAATKRIAHMTLTPWVGKGSIPAAGLWYATLELGAPIRRTPVVHRPWDSPYVPSYATTAARAVIYIPSGDKDIAAGYPPVLVGADSGDFPAPGHASVPTTAGMVIETIVVSGNTWYTGVRVNRPATLTIRLKTSYNSAYAGQTVSSDFEIRRNTVVLVNDLRTATFTNPGAFSGTVDITATDVKLMAGDLIHMWAEWTASGGGLPVTIPAGVGIGDLLDITGTIETGALLNAPYFAQPVREQATGDGVTTHWTTNWSFNPATLQVRVSGVRVIPLEMDGTAGTFILPYAYKVGAPILIEYAALGGAATGTANITPPDSHTVIVPELLGSGSTGSSGQGLLGDGTWGTVASPTADYLVGTAQASLSGEIVVGTTPGGELGGTWASPTVDATHSGSTHPTTAAIEFIIDGGGVTITTGVKGFIEIPFACTITAVRLLADQSGSIVVDIWRDTYANFAPTVADTITAAAKPTITTATKSENTTLTGWTTALSAGHILAYNVDSVTSHQRVTVSLIVSRV